MRLSSIDHDWFVAMKMPSFGVADDLRRASPRAARCEMLVMRIERQVRPSVGAAACRSEVWPTTGAVSRLVRKFWKMPSTMIGRALRGHAFVVEAERAEPAGERGVGGDRDQRTRRSCSVPRSLDVRNDEPA